MMRKDKIAVRLDASSAPGVAPSGCGIGMGTVPADRSTDGQCVVGAR
jgi:hypothetical protein